jgi:hypothetical protein
MHPGLVCRFAIYILYARLARAGTLLKAPKAFAYFFAHFLFYHDTQFCFL